MLRHLPDVLPVLVQREAHDGEDPVQLVVVVRVARLDVLLTTVEYGFRRQQLGEDAADRPNVCKGISNSKSSCHKIVFIKKIKKLTDGLRVMSGSQQQFRRPVPESDYHRVQVCQGLEGGVEQPGEAHIGDLDTAALLTLAHHQDVGRFLKATKQSVSLLEHNSGFSSPDLCEEPS